MKISADDTQRMWMSVVEKVAKRLDKNDDKLTDVDRDVSVVKKFVTLRSGAVYSGQWLDGKRNGHGTMTWPEGTRFEGNWHEGHRHGFGKVVCLNGASYEGHWLNDLRHGDGCYMWPHGDKYQG